MTRVWREKEAKKIGKGRGKKKGDFCCIVDFWNNLKKRIPVKIEFFAICEASYFSKFILNAKNDQFGEFYHKQLIVSHENIAIVIKMKLN